VGFKMLIITNKILVVLTLFASSTLVNADLITLEDSDLSEVDGEGIGLVLEDFIYNAGEAVNGGGTFEINGLQTSDDKDVTISISQFYIAASGSNQGTILNPVNIGRLNNPFNIELRDGDNYGVDNKAIFEFSAPSVANGSRLSERPDVGIRFDLDIDGNPFQSLDNHIKSLSIDGSYLRLWGGGGRMEGEVALNIYTPNMAFFACDSNHENCGQTVEFRDVSIEAKLGYGEFQPVTFDVSSDGHFHFSVGTLEGKCATNSTGGCVSGSDRNVLIDFYDNGPKTNIYIDNVVVAGQEFGTTTVSNLQIQYLDVRSRDL